MPNSLERRLKGVVERDARYACHAYRFVYEALDYTLKKIGCKRHVSGRELLFGIRDLAIEQFGGLANMVFDGWGIKSTADWGQIVWNLADAGLMSRSESDTLSDFEDVYDFARTFTLDARPGEWI
jgi:uncharacterized repeat protein (TIGR04138 family)